MSLFTLGARFAADARRLSTTIKIPKDDALREIRRLAAHALKLSSAQLAIREREAPGRFDLSPYGIVFDRRLRGEPDADAQHDQARVARVQRGDVQTPAVQRAGAEVFHQHVALQHHLAHQGLAIGVCQVQRDGAFVAVGAGEVAGLVGVLALRVLQEGRPPMARVVARAGGLDLDHVGAQVGQDLGAPGAGQHP